MTSSTLRCSSVVDGEESGGRKDKESVFVFEELRKKKERKKDWREKDNGTKRNNEANRTGRKANMKRRKANMR